MKSAAAVVALLLAGVGAYAYVVTRAPERELTAAELAWVRAFAHWREERWRHVAAAYDELDTVPDRHRIARLAGELGTCSRSFEPAPGEVPETLAAVGAAAGDACAAAEDAAERLSEGGSSALVEARRLLLEADQAFVRADSLIDRRLLLGRALPVLEGPSLEGRVDPRLSEAATAVSGVPMSVRCWSRSDWPQVSAELAALGKGGREGSERSGRAGVWGGEPNLSHGVCAALAPVLDGRGVSRSTPGLAQALAVLARTISHASGTVDGTELECRGIQLVQALAARLGVPQAAASDLAARARGRDRATEGLAPDRPATCRPGGSGDEQPVRRS